MGIDSMVSRESYLGSFELRKDRVLIFVYVLAIVFGYTTYLTQNFFGELIAEGLVVFFTGIALLISCFLVRQRSTGRLFNLFLFYTLFIFVVTLIHVVAADGMPGRLIFIYQYIYVLAFLYIYNGKAGISSLYKAVNVEFLIKLIVVVGVVSSLFGIMQILSTSVWPPIDTSYRARGLSRSTLNYSALCFISFQAATVSKFNKRLKIFFMFMIFLGILSSFSRGAMLACFVSIILSYVLLHNSRFSIISLICLIIFLITWQIYSHNSDTVLRYSERFFSAFDIQTGPGNAQRIASMRDFLGPVLFFPGGLGSTGPAAGRFNNATGFESSILNFLYQGGLLAILFLPFLFFLFVVTLVRRKKWDLLTVIIPQAIVLSVQQVHENPSVNSLFWIFLSLVSLRR
jgi:hypothetical protein